MTDVQVKGSTAGTGRVGDDAPMPRPFNPRDRGSGNTPLARFLVGEDAPPPHMEALRAALLSGSTLARFPSHPDRARLGLDARSTAARHLAVKAELLRLLMA